MRLIAPTVVAWKIVLPAAVAAIVVAGALGFYFAYDAEQQSLNELEKRFEPAQDIFSSQTASLPELAALEGTQELKKFSSEKELKDFLRTALQYTSMKYRDFGPSIARSMGDEVFFSASSEPAAVSMRESALVHDVDSSSEPADYSTTNIQVAGVDEPDFLKSDGKYIYIVREKTLAIIDAHPADEAAIISKVALDIESQYLRNMFLNQDRLVIFYHGSSSDEVIPEFEYLPRQSRNPATHAMLLDISDREEPRILKDYKIDGSFEDARMIGSHVYFITTMWADHAVPIIPYVADSATNDVVLRPDVFYFDNIEEHYNFNTITAINMFDEEYVNSETFLMGHAGTIYVSQDSFYVTYGKNFHPSYYDSLRKDRFFDVIVPLLPEAVQDRISQINSDSSLDSRQKWLQVSAALQDAYNSMEQQEKKRLFDEIEQKLLEYDSRTHHDRNKTVIHRILLQDGSMEYHARGEVPGWLLNQFSMSEYKDRFRVATTNEQIKPDGRFVLSNAVYVLDNDDMSIVGSAEGLAENESIFSARFMQERLYLVTFERVDPFFVIDLSGDQPVVLGELKIPGFSNYLHPYDENHVIGIGKDTKEQSGRVIETGVKIALFDVSDVSNPTVLDDTVIGDRGTYSAAQHNHKAFLFDRDKDILSIPIEGMTREIAGGQGNERWYGFYVYGLDAQDGFELKGKIDHSESLNAYLPSGPRSLYIGDVLYTVSANLIKMNDINSIEDEINSISMGPSGKIIEYLE